MKFTKMHGTGNDYVYINCFKEEVSNPAELAIKISNRNFGIGSDGLILIKPSDVADCKMDIYNADGSLAKMCGNGIRCVAKYAYEHGIEKKEKLTIETFSGIKTLDLETKDNRVINVNVNMGEPKLNTKEIPVLYNKDNIINEKVLVKYEEYYVTCVSMGNPHCVLFVADTVNANVESVGSYLEKHEMFPEGVNVEFVQVINRGQIRMRVWERGSGETMSCGTGACASVVAAILNGYTDNKVEVEVLGGRLWIHWDKENNFVYMKGSAMEVYSGELSKEFAM
ncbi:MAG: diaminopimelate epimerase [Clostridiales bacterium]|nr:diaminopimelate epimerase [Clostridiales bacterium]